MARKVIPLEDRLPQLKKERKKRANRRFAFYATIFFLLILCVVFFQSPLSRINHLIISGEQIATSRSIEKASGISGQTHLWDLHAQAVQRRVEALPSIERARVKLSFPNTVTIQVREYSRKAYLMKNGRYYPILQNGTLLSALSETKMPADAPVLIGFSSRQALKSVAEGLSRVPQPIIHNLSDIHYQKGDSDGDNLILYMNDGNRVIANTKTFADNIRIYPDIAAHLPQGKKGTIYLSIGSYFVPNGSSSGKK